MANDIVQTIAEARVDARSLSEFVFKPAGFKVARRLAPTVDTLQFYIDRFDATKATTDAYVTTIPNIVNDAINNTAVEGGVLADTFVTVTANGTGSVARTQRDKNADVVSVKDFGAKGDGATDDTQALKNALLSGAKNIYVPEGVYCISETLKIPKNVNLNGAGIGYFYDHPVTFLFMGVGSKDYIMEGVTDTVYQVANPSIGEAYLADSGTRGDTYKLNNYAENFSVCIEVLEASQLSNIFATTDNGGVAGYTTSATKTLATNWDVGILCRNANSALISRVWAFGHFAKAGLLVTAHSFAGDTETPSSELLRVSECGFSGQFGVSLRTQDTVVGNNWGFGGTIFDKCYIRGIEQSLRLSTSDYFTNPTDRPSGAIEISGDIMRGISFNNCTAITRQDINIIAGECSDININNSYFESKQVSVNSVWQPNSTGSRMVFSKDSKIKFSENQKYGIDFSPRFTRESSVGRYIATGTLSKDALVRDDDFERVNYTGYKGVRLNNSTDWWGIADYNNDVIYKFGGTSNITFMQKGANPELTRTDAAGVGKRIMWVSGTSGDIEVNGTIYPAEDNVNRLGLNSRRYQYAYINTLYLSGVNVTPSRNGELVLTIEDDTTVSLRLRGADGVLRKASIALA